MFAARYFPGRYFARRYFPQVGATVEVADAPRTIDTIDFHYQLRDGVHYIRRAKDRVNFHSVVADTVEF